MNKPWIDKICQECGELFYVEQWRDKKAKYCSWRCGQIGKARVSMEGVRGTGTRTRYVKLKGRHMHRVVAERKLGRPLVEGEVVHHKDGNTRNNEPENLEVTIQPKHIMLHFKEMMAARKAIHGY